MNARPKYKTKQKEILTEYFESLPGVHITANDVCEYFKKTGTPIGQATIYRRLENLVEEGIIRKYIIDSNSPACFEYVGKEIRVENGSCFHCKCEKCGKLIHLRCDELMFLKDHLEAEHDFRLDPLRTVFYGICDECRNAEN
jgi:Fur family ferric uptake transcriptional regulator